MKIDENQLRKVASEENNKSKKKQGFSLTLENTLFEKPQGEGEFQIDTPSRFIIRRNITLMAFIQKIIS